MTKTKQARRLASAMTAAFAIALFARAEAVALDEGADCGGPRSEAAIGWLHDNLSAIQLNSHRIQQAADVQGSLALVVRQGARRYT